MTQIDLKFPADHCFINGEWVAPKSGQTLELIDPSDGTTLCDIARGSQKDIDDAVTAAKTALDGSWGKQTALERGRILQKFSTAILDQVNWLAELEARDVGKPLTQAKNDAIALARYLEFYGGACDKIHGHTIPYLQDYTVYTLREPHGVTAHIIPWNYPMQIIGRSVGAALAMGNGCVLKPAEEACLTALAFAKIAQDIGLPDGALNVVPGLGQEAGAALAGHTNINHISFTGSVKTGIEIQRAAAENIVPVTLELGGKSPQIVFNDADLEKAFPFLVNAGIQNAGQTCSASSRILVQQDLYEATIAAMSEAYHKLIVGPAMADCSLGPLVSHRQKEIVEHYINMARSDQISVAATGAFAKDIPENGAYILPTLYKDVPPDHALAQEEIFGPIQVMIPFKDEDHAIKIANDTDFGLVAGVWTRDGSRQMRMAKAIKTGQVFINNYGAGGGVELPFGGHGKSGHGREKGFEALYGFSTLKTVANWHGR